MRRIAIPARCAGALALCAFALLHPGSAAASEPQEATSSDEEAPPAPRRLGLMFDVGSIEGGMLSLSARPTHYLRLEAGAGSNAVSPGFRLGIVALPFGSWPTFSLSGGHFFEGDINGIARAFSVGGYTPNPRLEHFDYDFTSLQLGWQKEAAGLLFFAQAGASLLWTDLPSASNVSNGTEPFWLVLPSLRLGFIGFL